MYHLKNNVYTYQETPKFLNNVLKKYSNNSLKNEFRKIDYSKDYKEYYELLPTIIITDIQKELKNIKGKA